LCSCKGEREQQEKKVLPPIHHTHKHLSLSLSHTHTHTHNSPCSAPGSTEATIYASERNLGNSTGTRLHSVSLDSGATFSPARAGFDPTLPDVVTANWTGCVAGLARFAQGGGVRGPLLFSTPEQRGVRANLSLWVSENEGASWGAPRASLWAGPAAYSDLAQVNATHVGVVFEGGPRGSGDFAAAIYFAAFSMS
jgi:hypothetical protein